MLGPRILSRLRSRSLHKVIECNARLLSSETIDFGFKQVPFGDKMRLVHEIFNSVSGRYDLMNDLMSAGMHRIWKDDFVAMMNLETKLDNPTNPPKVLDLASGTGDIGFRIVDRLKLAHPHIFNNLTSENSDKIEQYVVLSDINEEMLNIAKKRANEQYQQSILQRLRFEKANAEELPFDSDSFDFCTISFGIRNVSNREKSLQEIKRVLKPGGKFMCLEFCPSSALNTSNNPITPVLKQFYDAYSFHVIPAVGDAITGNRQAYEYLVESIRTFPAPIEFQKIIHQAGFKFTNWTHFGCGLVAVHWGYKEN